MEVHRIGVPSHGRDAATGTDIGTRVAVAILLTLVLATVAGAGPEAVRGQGPSPAPTVSVAPALQALFPPRIGDRDLDVWTLEGGEWYALYDLDDPADQQGAQAIDDFLARLGRDLSDLSLGNGVYAASEGGFASLTAVRVAGTAPDRLLEEVLILWGRDRAGDPQTVVLEDGSEVEVVPLTDPAAQVPTLVWTYAEGDVAWLIEAMAAELPTILGELRRQLRSPG